jgi:hypothetical protein
MKGIDISQMKTSCKTLLTIAGIALEQSRKHGHPLDRIKIYSKEGIYPKLCLEQGSDTTTIRYFNDPIARYPFAIYDGNDMTRQIALETGQRVNVEHPEMGLTYDMGYSSESK